MSLLFIIIYSVWLVFEVLLNRLVRAKKKQQPYTIYLQNKNPGHTGRDFCLYNFHKVMLL